MKPDKQDVAILLLLAQWSALLGLSHSLGRIRPVPAACNGNSRAILPDEALAICEYFELVGMLHGHGLLNDELLFEWVRVSPAWDGVKEYVAEQRHARGTPRLWANFEALAIVQKRMTREYST
jgi:hypothetical protein